MDIHNTSEKAQASIGAMIVFIAIVLTAAIAAGVLLSTSSDLHEKGDCPPSGDDDYEIKDGDDKSYDLWSAPREEDGNPADKECWTYIGGRAELHNSTQE